MAGMRVEVCPDEGRAMRSSPLRRQAQRFGRRHSQPPIEFPCSAPQRSGKSPKMPGNLGECRLNIPMHIETFDEPKDLFADDVTSARDVIIRNCRRRCSDCRDATCSLGPDLGYGTPWGPPGYPAGLPSGNGAVGADKRNCKQDARQNPTQSQGSQQSAPPKQ